MTVNLTDYSKHLAVLRAQLVKQHGEDYVRANEAAIEWQAQALAEEYGELLTNAEFDPAKLGPDGWIDRAAMRRTTTASESSGERQTKAS